MKICVFGPIGLNQVINSRQLKYGQLMVWICFSIHNCGDPSQDGKKSIEKKGCGRYLSMVLLDLSCGHPKENYIAFYVSLRLLWWRWDILYNIVTDCTIPIPTIYINPFQSLLVTVGILQTNLELGASWKPPTLYQNTVCVLYYWCHIDSHDFD